ncbi:MAG: hypothetical protein Q4C12_07300 [Clostridia bacterium]|nr:hypothetical protein [Clostridia bacterium]
MNLKASFFSKSLIKSDLKRLWWVIALEFLMIFISSTLPVINSNPQNYFDRSIMDYNSSVLYSSGTGSILLALIFPTLISVLLFRYQNSSSGAAAIHSLPLTRATIFRSHILVGLIIMYGAILLNSFVFMLLTLVEVGEYILLRHIIAWCVTNMLYQTLFFSASCFVAFVTGNSLAHAVFSYIFVFLPIFFEMSIDSICSSQLYGYSESYRYVLSDLIYSSPDEIYRFPYAALSAAICVVLFSLGYLLYKARRLERAGDIMVFAPMRPIFTLGVAICSGLVGFFYFYYILGISSASLLYSIPFGFVGLVIAQMLIQKTFRIKKVGRYLGIYVCAALALFVFLHFDLSGFERKIPAASNVANVRIDNCEFTDSTDIENVVSLHRHLIDTRNSHEDSDYSITMFYTLNDTASLRRLYPINLQRDAEFLAPVYESAPMRQMMFSPLYDENFSPQRVSVSDIRFGKEGNQIDFYPTQVEMNELLSAFSKDADTVPFNAYINSPSHFTSLEIYFHNDFYSDTNDSFNSRTYPINGYYTNTLNYLLSIGFFDSLPDASKLDTAEISLINSRGYNSFMRTTDKDDIYALYAQLCTKIAPDTQDAIGDVCFFAEGESYYQIYTDLSQADWDALPESVKNKFETLQN